MSRLISKGSSPSTEHQNGKAVVSRGSTLRLRSVLLLAGAVHPNELVRSTRRCVLDLPVRSNRHMLDHWFEQIAALPAGLCDEAFDVRLLVNRHVPWPGMRHLNELAPAPVEVIEDGAPCRGTAGALRDAVMDLPPEEEVLIVEAGRLLLQPLARIMEHLRDSAGQVKIACQTDQSPAGLMAMPCRLLQKLPEVGYLDLKEQVLPQLARRHDVRIHRFNRDLTLPMRTICEYLHALRQVHRSNPAGSGSGGFALVEEGASVAEDAVLHDAVVLEGARVERGSVLIRSIVTTNGRVPAGQTLLDQCVQPDLKRRRRR